MSVVVSLFRSELKLPQSQSCNIHEYNAKHNFCDGSFKDAVYLSQLHFLYYADKGELLFQTQVSFGLSEYEKLLEGATQ